MARGRPAQAIGDAELSELDAQLRRTIRKARRRRRDGGTAWTTTIDEAIRVADRIAHVEASDMAGIAIKLGALRWFLDETGAVLDLTALRQLRSLHRDALKLARADK